jgi:hypothetical protein
VRISQPHHRPGAAVRAGTGRHLSRTTALACAALFVAGVVIGAITYLNRSAVAKAHVPGTNAIATQVVLALVAAALFVGLPRLRLAQRAPYPVWVAPFSRSGYERLARTVRMRSGASAGGAVRAVLAALLTALLLFNFLRAGAQVIGGLDPNFTVNAWGGPGYLGALLAHYLDAAYLFYAEALLLNLVLVGPDRTSDLD